MHRQYWISILLKGETSACTQLNRIVIAEEGNDFQIPPLTALWQQKLIPLFNVGDNWKKGHNQSHATLRPELIPTTCNKAPNAYRGEIVVILYLKHWEILQCSTSGHVLWL
jgi:hypothetical protein